MRGDVSEEPRDETGKWTSGGGGGGGTPAATEPSAAAPAATEPSAAASKSVSEKIKETAQWMASAPAQEVIVAVVSSHGAKEALSASLQSLLSHATGLDASTWKLNEELVNYTVHNFADIAHFSAAKASAAIRTAVTALITLRQKQRADDPVLEVLGRVLDALDQFDASIEPDPKEGAMPVRLNHAGERNAQALIADGKYDDQSAWSFSAEDGDKLLGDGKDWEAYAKWFLGEATSAADQTKDRYKYPFGKDGTIYRAALRAIRSRSAQNKDTQVFEAAGRLLNAMDDADAAEDAADNGADEANEGRAQRITINIDARGAPVDLNALMQRYAGAGAAAPVADGIEVRRSLTSLLPQTLNESDRSIDMCVSTGAPVRRYDWQSNHDYDEVLDIAPGAIRLGRLNAGAPLLDSHDSYSGLAAMLGAIVPGSARVENGELRARAVFSRNPRGDAAYQDALQGVLRHVSVGYLTHKQVVDNTKTPPVYRATDWEPYEVSAVPMPADPRAGFRSSVPHQQPVSRAEPANMERSMTTANAAGGSPAIVAATVVDEALIAARVEEGIKKERERCDMIAEEGRDLGLSAEFVDGHVKARTSLAEFRPFAIKETKRMRAAVEQEQEQRGALPRIEAPSIINGLQPSPREQQFESDGARTLSSLVAESRSISRREQRPVNFDDCLSIARRGLGVSVDRSKSFRSFGEQLHAICAYYASHGTNVDKRLVRAPTGAGEVDPTAGGFLVQVDFQAGIFMLAHDMGEILSRVNKIPISTNSNGLKIPGVDETSRASGSRWGGVVSSWVAEGVGGTESRPKFRLVEFDLKKLISKMTVTDELLQDQAALTAIASQAFSEEITFMTEDAIVEGTGSGQPMGYINSPAVVSVAKKTGQAAATIVKENIDDMWSRCWNRSRSNAVWLINQDCEPQLNALNQSGGASIQLVYLPPGGLSAAPYSTLYGRPVIATEYNAALGTVGDITLVDLSQYTVVDKGGVQMATSMHVAFDTDEMRFRITYRVDGRPMWSAPLTPFKGSATKSPFITLATR